MKFENRKRNRLRDMIIPGTENIWQRSYYDHIIRDEDDYLKIWEYIDNNPAKWIEDKYHTK